MALWYNAGTLSLTQGSQVAVGIGTSFLSKVKVGDMLIAPGPSLYEVESITNDTQLRLTVAYTGDTVASTPYSIVPTVVQLKLLASQVATLVAQYSVIPDVATDAQAALQGAQVARDAALTAETEAETARDQAVSLKDQAGASAVEAANQVTLAQGKVNDAAAQVSLAEGHKTAAQAAQAAAEAAQGLAETAKTGADAAKADAETIAASSAASATAAADSAADAAASAASIADGPVASFNTRTGVVTLTKADVTGTGLAKADVGLGNVDNVADANKPVSTAQQAALDQKFDKVGGTVSGATTFNNDLTATGGTVTLGKPATNTTFNSTVYVPGNATTNASIRVGSGAQTSDATLILNKKAGTSAYVLAQEAGTNKWALFMGDANGAFTVGRYSGGAWAGSPIAIDSTGYLTLGEAAGVNLNGPSWAWTPGTSDWSTRIATTAYVKSQATSGNNGNGAYFLAFGFQLCRSTITIPATASVTWTFPAAFPAAPQVFFATNAPPAAAEKAMWMSGVTSTYVSIYNPNSVATNINVLAVF